MRVLIMKYNPGSPEAIERGCTCPILDNAHGKGYMGGVRDDDGELVFVISQGCPLHDKTEEDL